MTGTTCLIGLIGKGIQRSKSPALHQQEAQEHGIRCLYQLIDLAELNLGVESLPRLLESAELMGFAALNITHPCKQAVIPLMHELSEEAQAIGAVNTVKLQGGRRIGYNTDAIGFTQNLRHRLPGAAIKHVTQLGAGGAGSAIAYALLKYGVENLTLYDVDSAKAHGLAANLARHFSSERIQIQSDPRSALANAQGLVNTTPMGTREHPGLPVPEQLLRPDLWVADIVYFPLETPLLRSARELGCRTLDGGGMVVYQAEVAFEIFTGRKPSVERMFRHFASLPVV